MIALDLSRLLSRARFATPTGIDRVELAYARWLLSRDRAFCFAARNAVGGIGKLPEAPAAELIGSIGRIWREGGSHREMRRTRRLAWHLRLAALSGAAALPRELRQGRGTAVYLSVSHHGLERPHAIARLRAISGARFVCMIHDLIPLEHPVLVRPGQAARHTRRIATVEALADAVIANSAATRDSLHRRLGAARAIPTAIAPLGIDLPARGTPAEMPGSYFVCVGTIEARKNHRLLLDLWQRLAADLGERTPRLMLIGRRAFGSEAIATRIAAANGTVIEYPDMPDMAMAALLRGARGLLLPSFAEGFGLPVVEALAQGVPVLCSDLPALRESGGNVPDYLEPTDRTAWHRAVLDHVDDSSRRRAQFARLASWQPPRWNNHFTIVERLIAGLD